MKNLIKSVVSYTVLVGVPIMCIGSISAAIYKVGREDGKQEGLEFASEKIKAVAYEALSKTEEE